MTVCACGHIQNRHSDKTGRCDGLSEDPIYGRYRCMCPTYQPVRYCNAQHNTYNGWAGTYPRCARPPGHAGPHTTTYGLKFNDQGETIQ